MTVSSCLCGPQETQCCNLPLYTTEIGLSMYIIGAQQLKKKIPILNKVSWLSLSLRTLFSKNFHTHPYRLLHTRPGELNRSHIATKLLVHSQETPLQSPNHSKNLQDNPPTATIAGRKLLENCGCFQGEETKNIFVHHKL